MLQDLIKYGLSEKEANVYLTCLKLGEATAIRITEMSTYPRSTIYDILERLRNLGLVSTCIVEGKTHFIVNSPKNLLTLLKEKEELVSNLLPQLEKVYNKIGERPRAEIFLGKKSLLNVFDEILGHNKEIYLIGCKHNAFEKIDYLTEKFRIKRVEKKIKIKQILEDSKEARSIPIDKYTKVKFLNKVQNNKEVTFIVADYVYHVILQYELSVVRIKSKEHADSMRVMFEELWNKSRK